ncbi:MAG: serine/threonine protein kinase, partial [Calditrichales bacterium]
MTPVPPHKKPLPFEKINGYRIAEVLADGTHTWSCRGYEAGLDRNVFVKILKPHIDEYEVWKKRFQQEARICARLKHPYIVEVYGLGRIDTFDYLITEYVEGSDLKTLLDANHHLPVEAALFIMTQLLETLDYIHTRGIIHADLKPNNLLLDRFGRIKLTDFGLAWSAETVEPGFRDVLIGTPAYMSPEQISGGLVDPRSDLFACGVLLFELLSGRRPFQGETYTECINAIINDPPTDIREFEPTLPESISEFLDRILQKKPEDRWASARQALENL